MENKKLKIGFIFTNFPIPGALFMYDKVTGMIDLGHDVHIFAFKPPKNEVSHSDVEKYNLLSKTKYYGAPIFVIDSVKIIAKDFLTKPVSFFKRLINAFDVKRVNNKGILNSYFFLKTFEKENDFDVFFCFSGPTTTSVVYLKKLFPKAKFIANFYGFDFSSRIRKKGIDIYTSLFPVVDCVIGQSFYSCDTVKSLGCNSDKIIKHPMGIRINDFFYKKREYNNELHLISVSRLVEKKAHRIILEALSEIVKSGYNIKYHIVGSGFLLKDIERLVLLNELSEVVTFSGHLNRDEIIELLHKSHVFIQPSITTLRWADMEDTPTTMLEAQATGMPVIGTYHAGIPDIIKNNETGLLVPERNVPELVKSIEFFIHNPEKINEYGINARDWVKKNFDNGLLSKKLEDYFYE